MSAGQSGGPHSPSPPAGNSCRCEGERLYCDVVWSVQYLADVRCPPVAGLHGCTVAASTRTTLFVLVGFGGGAADDTQQQQPQRRVWKPKGDQEILFNI